MRENVVLLQAVLDGTTDAIFVKDLAGKYLLINSVGAAFTGKTPPEILGRDDAAIFDPQTAESMQAMDRNVLADGIAYTYEQEGVLLAADRSFLVTKAPYRNPEGEIIGVLGIARDISPQKRAAEVVAQSARRFSTLAANSPTGIFEADEQGRIIYVNLRCCELFEISREQLFEIEGWNVSPNEDRERGLLDWQRFVASSDKYYELEMRFNFPGGRTRYILVTAVPLHDEEGNKTGFIGNVIDLTDQRKTQQELERRVAQRTSELVAANEQLRHEMTERLRTEQRLREQQAQLAHALRLRTLGEMAAEVAHEVNQPLSAITNYVHGSQRRLQAGSLTLNDVGPTLDFIAREAQRAADVIRRAKRFVSTQQPSRQLLDLNHLVRDALKMLEYEAREGRVKVTLDLAEGLPSAAGDPLQVEQVVVNLVRNAFESLDAMDPTAKSIRVITRSQNEYVEFCLEDSGPGLQPGQQERIFEAFYTTKPEGLGLGLPISRSIMEAHGGRLWAEADGGGGARFRFTLPVWENEHAPDPVL